jgi:hypothetical protein
MINCEYIRQYYNVPAFVNMRIIYKGEGGIIWKDGGNYVAACMDSDKPGQTINIHPTDPDLKYLEAGKPRKMTRGQQRYQDYLRSDCSESFAWFIGVSA